MKSTCRVRFAPSPTGQLHIGGARTALFNWAFARRQGGRFLLRVEDTDPERSKPEFERAILEGLAWLGIDWDEGPERGGDFGPYRQSERAELHLGVAAQLRRAGWAYPCFCAKDRLDALRAQQQAAKQTARYDGHCRELPSDEVQRRIDAGESFTLRFPTPPGETTFTDLVRGEVTFQNAEIDDWVMVRGDGTPTYNFVCVCDDAAMEITHVIRGEEHLVNTPKQILLFEVLGQNVPTYAHLPLMLGPGGKKMSKRDGDTALSEYRDKGFPPEAIVNYLALQGWALDGVTEFFGPEQLVANFELGDVSKGGSIFDIQKFEWLAGEHLRSEALERTAERALPFVVAAGCLSESEARANWSQYQAAVATTRERVRLYSQVPEQLAWLYADDEAVPFDEKAEKNARKQGAAGLELLARFATWVEPRLVPEFDREALGAEIKQFVQDADCKFPVLFQPLRCVLSGKAGGPEIAELLGLLGVERSLTRIRLGSERLA